MMWEGRRLTFTEFGGGLLIVVDHTLWKAKIKPQQHTKEENTDGKDVE
jgi:hypothetical protein